MCFSIKMTNLTMLDNVFHEMCSKIIPWPPRCWVTPWGWPLSSTQMSGGVKKNFQMTNFTMLNNIFSMKYSLKSVPGLADVGVLHGDGDGPRTPP